MKPARDVVDRLRRSSQLFAEAADEIERVRELYLNKCRELHNLNKLGRPSPKGSSSEPGIKVIPAESIREAISDAG